MSAPRVLFVGAGAPWAGGAGYLVRQDMFVRALVEFADVHLALFACDRNDAPYGARLTRLPDATRAPVPTWRSSIRDLVGGLPRLVKGEDPTEPRRAVAALDPSSYDAVFAYRVDFAWRAGVLGHPRLLLDVDDPEHHRRAQRAQLANDASMRTRLDVARTRRFELDAVASARRAFVCQAGDRERFPEPRPDVVPNCVDVPASAPRDAIQPTLLFVGNLKSGAGSPNVDAIEWMADEVWPRIRATTDATCSVVGGISDDLAARLERIDGIDVLGFVDDLAACYATAAVAIAPIRYGTGTRIKVLEAMAHACPVIGTTIGCEGIEARPGRDLLIADEAADFAEACLELLTDPDRRSSVGSAGRELVQRLYDLHATTKFLAEDLETMIAGATATISGR